MPRYRVERNYEGDFVVVDQYSEATGWGCLIILSLVLMDVPVTGTIMICRQGRDRTHFLVKALWVCFWGFCGLLPPTVFLVNKLSGQDWRDTPWLVRALSVIELVLLAVIGVAAGILYALDAVLV